MTPLKAPRKTGKWLRDDVPHTGWQCERIADPEDVFTRTVEVCEMCEVTGIVNQHVMTHEKLPGVELMCGYVCAAFMTGNAQQERVRELLYKWRQAFREQKTPIEKLRRKGWHGTHSSRQHEWTLHRKEDHWDDRITVRVSNGDGWRYRIGRSWWGWGDKSRYIHSEPFASDVEAALAGIERVELLLAEPQWIEADREAKETCRVAWKAEQEERDRRSIIRVMNEGGFPDLAAALEQGSITISEACHQRRERLARDAAKAKA